jgi:hypothetical protein
VKMGTMKLADFGRAKSDDSECETPSLIPQ